MAPAYPPVEWTNLANKKLSKFLKPIIVLTLDGVLTTSGLGRRHNHKEHSQKKDGEWFSSFPLPLTEPTAYAVEVQHCINP